MARTGFLEIMGQKPEWLNELRGKTDYIDHDTLGNRTRNDLGIRDVAPGSELTAMGNRKVSA